MAQRQVTDAEVEALHDRIISIDTHNDFSLAYCFPNGKYSTTKGQVSFDKMTEGRLDCAVFAAYIDQGKCDDAGHEWARNRAETMIAGLKKYAAENSDKAEIVYSSADIERAKQRIATASALIRLLSSISIIWVFEWQR